MTPQNILKISPREPERSKIRQAAEILMMGGVVVAPTETRYGLLGRIDDMSVIDRIYRLKRRDSNLPTAVFVRSRREVFELGCENRLSRILCEKFLPGPLTIVLKDRSGFPKPIVIDDKIGLRYSSSPVISRLLETVEPYLSATSANISGNAEPETVSEIAGLFGAGIDLYLDSGRLKALPSAVVDCSGDEYKILRTGAITDEEIVRGTAEN